MEEIRGKKRGTLGKDSKVNSREASKDKTVKKTGKAKIDIKSRSKK